MDTDRWSPPMTPLRTRLARTVKEREIIHANATFMDSDIDAIDQARRAVLAWAQNRLGSRLPLEAWAGESFEHMQGGRLTLGARVQTGDVDLWALRNDDPDKTVAGRTWTTEVAIGRGPDQTFKLSLRLLVSSHEATLDIAPAVPGLLQQIATSVRMTTGLQPIRPEPMRIRNQVDAQSIIDLLQSSDRTIPLIVVSSDERSAKLDHTLIDISELARNTVGIAHVVYIPSAFTYQLTESIGRRLSVYNGAVRFYMPGFSVSDDPYDHRLFLADAIRADRNSCASEFRRIVATESVRRRRVGHEVLSFFDVRAFALQVDQERERSIGASDSVQLSTVRKQILLLEDQVAAARQETAQFLEMAHGEEARAKTAEANLRGATARIEQLEMSLTAKGQSIDDGNEMPSGWQDFAEWFSRRFAGRLRLTPTARRNTREAAFTDFAMVARCLIWLAEVCRERRLNGGGHLSNVPVEPGIENAPCGADSFRFDFEGRGMEAEWHIKSGGNTRDPARCLRIYYAWDETSRQIVIADLPAHRKTGAS